MSPNTAIVQEHGYDPRYDDLVAWIEKSDIIPGSPWDMANIFRSNAGFFASYILEHCVDQDGLVCKQAQPCIEVQRHDTQVTCGYSDRFNGNYKVIVFDGRRDIPDYFICLEYMTLEIKPVKPYKRLEWLVDKSSCLLHIQKSLLSQEQETVGYEWF